MNTFAKLLLLIAVAWLAVHLLPIVIAPLVLLGIIFAVVGSFAASGFAFAASIGLTLVGVMGAVALVLVAVLSPLWIPVVIVCALVALTRKLLRSHAN